LIKEATDRLVSCSADKDDAKPSQERNQAAGHAFFAAGIDAGAEYDDEKEVEGVKGQGIKAHDRVLSFDVRANCIECRLNGSGFCANGGKYGAVWEGNRWGTSKVGSIDEEGFQKPETRNSNSKGGLRATGTVDLSASEEITNWGSSLVSDLNFCTRPNIC
jgi:hypothetical protein